MTDVN